MPDDEWFGKIRVRVRRVDAFSDGVFAIAITLLVVELPFANVPDGHLANALGEHWPRFAAYVVSFLGIGLVWLHHHAIFEQIVDLDRRLLLLNLVLLMSIAFLPFPTQLLGDYIESSDDARTAAVLYGSAWVVTAGAMATLWRHALRHGLVRDDVGRRASIRFLWIFRFAALAYAAFTVVAIVSPIGSLALFAVAALVVVWRSDYAALERDPEQLGQEVREGDDQVRHGSGESPR